MESTTTAADLLKPVIVEIVASLKRQINYFCCFNKNVERLMEQAEKLKDEMKEVQERVDAAGRNSKNVVSTVKTWLRKATEFQDKIAEIEDDIPNQKGCSLSQFSFSKKAKKTAEAIEKLRDERKFDTVSEDTPPPSMDLFQLRHEILFPSRKPIEDEIVKALIMPDVNIIGIAGMGGVGKTTMAEKIIHRMKKENLVDETVKVVVTQPIDMLKIQQDIAEYVGNKDLIGVKSLQVRAKKLRTCLTRGKKILIVLDDVWEEFKLEDLGIPCESGSNGCITLLTSRDRGLLKLMGAKVYVVKTLREEEAWTLFRATTGTCVDNPDLASTPQDIVKECKGLPIAIITIGKSLKDQPKETWKDALPQLKRSRPDTLPKVLDNVYMPLKFSYDSLKYKGEKSLFLLCCLFPEDFLIGLEELTSYIFGLRMFEVDNLEETRNKVLTVVEVLKSRFLLLDCEDINTVKVHDVVRDVGNFIASEEGIIDSKLLSKVRCEKSCKWISIFTSSNTESFDHLTGCNFPCLGLLTIQHTSALEDSEVCRINDVSFLEAMEWLHVLSWRKVSSLSWPQSMASLKNLRTLRLVGCYLASISLVGDLLNLEILICSDCKGIEELPIEIRRLKCLKLLDISGCSKLQRIEPRIISELIELEELKMVGSFNGWESKKVHEEQKRNASIKEIELLHKLINLEIEINDINLAEEEIHLPTSIAKYKIFIGGKEFERFKNKNEKVVHLRGVSREIQFASWIHKVVSTTEALYLDGDGSINIDLLNVYKTIKILVIKNCETMKELILIGENEKKDGNSNDTIKFSKLVKLWLHRLPNLTSVVRGTKSIELPLLEVIWIRHCAKLKTLISSEKSGPCYDCNNDSLHLFCNPEVKHERLKRVRIAGYENVNIVWCPKTPMIFFKTLESVVISGCTNVKMLFSSSMVENLVNLIHLQIEECEQIEEIIVNDEEDEVEIGVDKMRKYDVDGNSNLSHVVFPKLEELWLTKLSSLKALGKHIPSIQLPIPYVSIQYCPNLRRSLNISNMGDCDHDESLHLFCQKVTFNGLSDLKIEGYDNVSKIWCQWTPIYIFTTLKHLEIVGCHKMRSLFSCCVVENLVNLFWLSIINCNNMEQVIAVDEIHKTTHLITFPKLEGLEFTDMPNLISLGKGIELIEFPMLTYLSIKNCSNNLTTIVSPSQAHTDDANNEKVKFARLKTLAIHKCNGVETLFSSPTDENHNLVNLSCLDVRHCNKMEQLVIAMETNKSHLITFPKLDTMVLDDMPNLTTLSKGIEIMEFPMLTYLWYNKCPNLTSIVSPHQYWEDGQHINNNNNDSPPSLFNEKVKFCLLEEVYIRECNNIGSLFSSSIVESLVNLKEICIHNCNNMAKVIANKQTIHENYVLFPRLVNLNLGSLPLLKMLCEWRCALQLPSLEWIYLHNCPSMEFLTLGLLKAPKLKELEIGSKKLSKEELQELHGVEDFNGFLHQRIISTRKKFQKKKLESRLERNNYENSHLKIIEANDQITSSVGVARTLIDELSQQNFVEQL